jgi:uncharacterized membrane protein
VIDPSGPPVRTSNPRLLAVAAYAGGLISGLIVLLLEKQNRFVRFHAMQSVVTFSGVVVAYLALTSVPVIGVVFDVPMRVAVVILWVFLMLKAWQGDSYRVPYVGDFAEHLLK